MIENLYKYNNANEVILVQVINPRGETRRRPASTGFNIFENSIYASAEWVGFKKNQFYIFASFFNKGQLLKEKNFLLEEQILSLKSRPYLRKEAIKLQKLFPLVKLVEGDRIIPY